MKKLVKYGIGTLVTAGVATGIAIPVANKVNEKKDVIRHIDMSQLAWGNTTLQQVVDSVKEDEKVSGSILTSVSKSATFIMYDKEQEASLKLQEMHFEFKLFQIREERAKLENEKSQSGTTQARKRQIDERLKDLTDDEKTTNDNKNKLTHLTKADYESATFISTFPKVLMIREVIKERQSKIFDDNKRAFVNQFSTKEEGENAWLDEQKKKYNGATNKNDAVAMLVYGIIRKDAYAVYNYELNGTYTKEMKDAVKADTTTKVFPFLANAQEKTTLGTKTDKVYFIATKSKDPSKIAVTIDATNKAIVDMASTKLVHLSHALIPVRQNAISATLPWEVVKEELIGGKKGSQATGFASMYGTASPATSFIESLAALFDHTATETGAPAEAAVKADNFFIGKALSQPTAAKGGSLGVKQKIESVKGMAPGFQVGIIEALHAIASGNNDHTEGDAVVQAIIDGVKKIFTDHSITNQAQLVAYVNSLSKDQITNVFGSVFRTAFGAKPKLYYLLSDHSFILRSEKFGIHFVKVEDFSNPQTLVDQINKDLKNAADDQAVSKVIINYTQLFANMATTDKVVTELLADSAVEAKLKAGYDKDAKDKNGEEIEDQMKTNADGTKVKMTWAEVKTSITKAVENIVASKKLNMVMSSLGNGIKKFLEDNIDKDLIDPTDGHAGTSTIDAEKIYNDALGMAA